MSQKASSLWQTMRHAIEASLLCLLFLFFRLVPLSLASRCGGKLGRIVGPKLRWHKIARTNLINHMPELDDRQRQQVLTAMWDNLGRTFAEYPWLGSQQLAQRITYSDSAKTLFENISNAKKPVIFASGHIANWELLPFISHLHDMDITLIYRHLNNPFAERLIYSIRKRYCPKLFMKGKTGARETVNALKSGTHIAMLVDQKMNDGTSIPFFGTPAMTAPAIANLALKYKAPIVMCHLVRTHGCNFTLDLQPLSPHSGEAQPHNLALPDSTHNTVESVLMTINTTLESWIRQHPAQWLWVHQRWGKIKRNELR